MTILILIIAGYLIYHAFHAGRKYQHYHKRGFFSRIWISIPGPFGTRISKRV